MRKLGRWLKGRLYSFDLLPDYFTAIAQRWQDVLWGASMPAVMFLLWWALGSPPNWALVLIFVIAMFVAGYYAWRAGHVLLIPRLNIDPTPRAQGSPTVNPQNAPTGYSVNYQLVVNNATEVPVDDCRGHLLSVLKLADDGTWQETAINEALVIQWTVNSNVTALTIYPGVPQRLNIFFAHSDGITRLSTIPLPMRSMDVLNRADTFRFVIRITAKDCAAIDVTMEIKIGPNPDNPEVIRLVIP